MSGGRRVTLMKFCAAAIDYFSIDGRSITGTPSFDQKDISRSDEDVLLHFLARYDLFVVEVVARPVDVHDDDLLGIGEIPKAPRIDQSFQDFGGDEQSVRAGFVDLALDVELLAVDGIHGNGHFGIDDILLNLLLDGFAQLHGGNAEGHEFADEVDGNFAVGADHVRTAEFGAVVDGDRDHVLGAEDVGVIVDRQTLDRLEHLRSARGGGSFCGG